MNSLLTNNDSRYNEKLYIGVTVYYQNTVYI